MDTPMTLEEYKKRAVDWVKWSYKNPNMDSETIEKVFKSLGLETDADWEMYMKDFSPEATMTGRSMNLI